MQKILLIQSDMAKGDELTFVLQHSGFQVVSAIEGQRVTAEIYRSRPDLIIMAETKRRLDGEELCFRIRELCQTPIIILGRDHDEAAGIDALEMGADVYLTSPLNLRELLVRVRSLLRSSQTTNLALRSD